MDTSMVITAHCHLTVRLVKLFPIDFICIRIANFLNTKWINILYNR